MGENEPARFPLGDTVDVKNRRPISKQQQITTLDITTKQEPLLGGPGEHQAYTIIEFICNFIQYMCTVLRDESFAYFLFEVRTNGR